MEDSLSNLAFSREWVELTTSSLFMSMVMTDYPKAAIFMQGENAAFKMPITGTKLVSLICFVTREKERVNAKTGSCCPNSFLSFPATQFFPWMSLLERFTSKQAYNN